MLSPVHNRKLKDQDRSLILEIVRQAGIEWPTIKDIQNAEKTFLNIEEHLNGRIAGPISEYLILFILAREIGRKNNLGTHHLVEIGTLFGGSTILMRKALDQENCNANIVTIDPLDGYYKADQDGEPDNKDLVLNIGITEDNFWHNIDAFNIPRDLVTLKKGFSQHQECINAAKTQPVSLLFIDGDHSLQGIQHDIENYSNALHADGFLLIDNFYDPDWPLVTEGILRDTSLLNEFQPILCHSKLLVLKKRTKAPNPYSIEQQFNNEAHGFLSIYRQRIAHLKSVNNNNLIARVSEYFADVEARLDLISKQINQNEYKESPDILLPDLIQILNTQKTKLSQQEDELTRLNQDLENSGKEHVEYIESNIAILAETSQTNYDRAISKLQTIDKYLSSQTTFFDSIKQKGALIEKRLDDLISKWGEKNRVDRITQSKIEKENAGLRKTLSDLSTEKAATESRLQTETKFQSEENSNLITAIVAKEQEIVRLENNILTLEKDSSKLEIQLRSNQQEKEKNNEILGSLNNKLESSKEDNTELRKSNAKLEERIQLLSDQLQSEREKNNEILNSLNNKLESSIEDNTELRKSNAKLEERIQLLLDQLQQNEAKHNEVQNSLSDKIDSLTNKLQAANAYIQKLNTKEKLLNFEKKSLLGELCNRQIEIKLLSIEKNKR